MKSILPVPLDGEKEMKIKNDTVKLERRCWQSGSCAGWFLALGVKWEEGGEGGGGGGGLLMGLWEDVWRNIPLIVSGHLFSPAHTSHLPRERIKRRMGTPRKSKNESPPHCRSAWFDLEGEILCHSGKMQSRMWEAFVIVTLCAALVSASCPEECRCPSEAPRCAAGVSLMPDGCGCCKVCARQLFEDCSRTQPCDAAKGLECNFGGRYGSAKGVCRAKSDGRTCEYSGKIYQNGETFRPNCKHQCTCMDGAVGCVSLCPRELLLLPKLDCARPRRVKIAGQCCEQLVCPEETKTDSPDAKKHRRKTGRGKTSEDELFSKNELGPAWREDPESFPGFGSHSKEHMVARGVQCLSQTTAWSPCSKSCGTGVSTRVTNTNPRCKLVKESRICEVRPCKQLSLKKRQKCNHTEKAIHPVKLSYAGCRSLKKFQPKYCGFCSDGRCCRPHRTQTLPVRFQCRNGETFSRMVMMIESCKCSLDCSGSNEKTPDLYRLLNDVHKLKM